MNSPLYSSHKSKGGLQRLMGAFNNSLRGFKFAFQHEAAFRQELAACILLLPVAIWLGQSVAQVAILVGALVFVLIVELLNSAIEALADKVCKEHDPLIGITKDVASAAVFLSIAFATICWITVIYSIYFAK